MGMCRDGRQNDRQPDRQASRQTDSTPKIMNTGRQSWPICACKVSTQPSRKGRDRQERHGHRDKERREEESGDVPRSNSGKTTN